MAQMTQMRDLVMALARQRAEAIQDRLGRDWAGEAEAANPARQYGSIHYQGGAVHVPFVAYAHSEGMTARVRHAAKSRGPRARRLVVRHPHLRGKHSLKRSWQRVMAKG